MHFGSQHNYPTGEAADLEWNGISFDVTVPPEQSRQDDPFINNCIQRGFMQSGRITFRAEKPNKRFVLHTKLKEGL